MFHSDRQSEPVIGPAPHHISSGNTELRFHECAVEFSHSSRFLLNIIEIYQDVIFGKDYRERCGQSDPNNVGLYLANHKKILKVNVTLYGEEDMSFSGFDVKYERYELNVDTEGKVNIMAKYYQGIIRGLDTFSQLIERNEESDQEYRLKYTPIEINDAPSYAYRGVMLDTSREYFFPDSIKQMLDGMMLGRVNVFHWHFIDTDSIPMYSETYPDLTDYTAFSSREIYTPEMVKDIVKYAKVRGMKILE